MSLLIWVLNLLGFLSSILEISPRNRCKIIYSGDYRRDYNESVNNNDNVLYLSLIPTPIVSNEPKNEEIKPIITDNTTFEDKNISETDNQTQIDTNSTNKGSNEKFNPVLKEEIYRNISELSLDNFQEFFIGLNNISWRTNMINRLQLFKSSYESMMQVLNSSKPQCTNKLIVLNPNSTKYRAIFIASDDNPRLSVKSFVMDIYTGSRLAFSTYEMIDINSKISIIHFPFIISFSKLELRMLDNNGRPTHSCFKGYYLRGVNQTM